MTHDYHRSKLKIGLLPYDLEANSYIERNRMILERIGAVLPTPRPFKLTQLVVKSLFSKGTTKVYDVLVVNWRENALVSNNKKITIKTLFEYYTSLLLYRVCTRKLIYVAHNKFPHNIDPAHIRFAKKIISFGLKCSDRVVVHSKPEACDYDNSTYVPHPLYSIPNTEPRSISLPTKQDFYVVIGRIQEYKNLDSLIKTWPDNAYLLILGPCNSRDYLEKLRSLAKDKCVIINEGFHSEPYLKACISSSLGVIISNNNDSMYVSGSYFFSISCGARILTLDSPFYRWVKTTELSDYIKIFSNLEEITKEIEGFDNAITWSPQAIKNSATLVFGDSEIESAWNKAISS